MPDPNNTLLATLLQRASSIGAPQYPAVQQDMMPPPVGGINFGSPLRSVIEGGKEVAPEVDPIKDILINAATKAVSGMGHQVVNAYEGATGNHIPRSISDIYHFMHDRDMRTVNAKPPVGTYPIATSPFQGLPNASNNR